MAIGVAVVLASSLLLATMPIDQSYWFQTFPAMVLSSFCPDFVYLAAQIIASNSVSRRHQGLASSLVGTLNLYGNSLGLGFAGTIETEVTKKLAAGSSAAESVADTVSGYRAALYFAAGIAFLGLVLDFAFVRVPKNEREGWDEELEDHSAPEPQLGPYSPQRRPPWTGRLSLDVSQTSRPAIDGTRVVSWGMANYLQI